MSLQGDLDTLTDAELLETLLGTGAGLVCQDGTSLREALDGLVRQAPTPRQRSKCRLLLELARRFGECEFRRGEQLNSSAQVYAHFRERLASENREHFIAVLLDNKNRKIKDVDISMGSLTASIVHPRDVYRPIIEESAAAVIFVHNHPSGDPTPSKDDLDITTRLRQVGEIVGVKVLDHIVIGKGRYVSFVDDGYW